MTRHRCTSLLLLVVASVGCRTPGTVAASLVRRPDVGAATGHDRCSNRDPTLRPLLVEWPLTDRAELEALAQRQVVAVRYEGCRMEVIAGCRVPGAYNFVATSPKRDTVHIGGLDALYAEVPLGAASLAGAVDREHALEVDLVVVGRAQADRTSYEVGDLEGSCEGATHVVSAITRGAFTVRSRARAEVFAHGSSRVVHAGIGSLHDTAVLSRDGDVARCEQSAVSGRALACDAPIRADLSPIESPPRVRARIEERRSFSGPPASVRSRRLAVASSGAFTLGGLSLLGGVLGIALYGMGPGVERRVGVGLMAGGFPAASVLLATGGVLQWRSERSPREWRWRASIVPAARGAALSLAGRF